MDTDEPYFGIGLSAGQLDAQLRRETDQLAGSVAAVAFPGRGGVLWHDGDVRLVGPTGAEFERAVDGLLDGIDVRSRREVRDALLSMGGARLVVDRDG
jgi:hypothetical protein